MDYNAFLGKIFQIKEYQKQQIRELAENLLKYLEVNALQVDQLLHDICGGKSCKVEQMMAFLTDKGVVSHIDLDTASKIDVDSNGLIDYYDIQAFTSRYQYIIQDTTAKPKPHSQVQLFPRKTVDEKKIDKLLQELKRRLSQKRIRLEELFDILDRNNDGFIDINEFQDGLKEIVEFT